MVTERAIAMEASMQGTGTTLNHGISVIAGLSRTNCLFRLHEGSIKREQHVEFLKALHAHLKRPLLIIWDGLKAHRGKLVRAYVDSTDGAVQMAFLPPYSPDLNTVEFLWAWLSAMPG
jgi:transposase